MSSGRDLNQREYLLSDLIELVKTNNLAEIRSVLRRDRSWTFDRGRDEESADYANFATKEAILSGNIAAAQLFFDEGVYINGSAYEYADKSGYTQVSFLESAISTGNLDMVELLVERGATVKQRNSNGNNNAHHAIMAAIENGNAEVADYLFQKGADPNEYYNRDHHMAGMTYLAHAARLGHLDLAEVIIRHAGSDVVSHAIYSAKKSYVDASYSFGRESRFETMAKTLKQNYSDKERKSKVEYAARSDYGKEDLKMFDKNKAELIERLEREQTEYENTIKTLLDFAPGQDFHEDADPNKFGLSFLKELRSLAGLNFVGVSVGCKPVTREMLTAMNLPDVDKAIFTLSDIDKIADTRRRNLLRTRVNKVINERAGLIKTIKPDEVMNLVPLAVAATSVEARGNVFSHILRKIAKYEGVNTLNRKGHSLLYRAVKKGDVALVWALLSHGANPNLQSKKGYPLITAVREIYNDSSRYGYRKEPSKEHLEIMHLLLAKGADPNVREKYVGTALEQAGESACMEAFNTLLPVTTLSDVIYPEYEDRHTHKKNYPWYTNIMHSAYEHAARRGSQFRRDEWKQMMLILKEKGADLNQLSVHGRSLLDAVMRDFPSYGEVMEAARAFESSMGGYPNGAEYRRRQKANYTDVLYSTQKSFFMQLDMLIFLLDLGADPTRKYGEDETTALHGLINSVGLSHIPGGYARVIDLCIARGFDINTADKNGNTLLHLAADGKVSAVKYLLSRGANTNLRNKDGLTPLHLAAGRGFHGSSPEIVKLLVQHGADDDAIHGASTYAQEQQNKWKASESFKAWKYGVQKEWLDEYNSSFVYLANPEQSRVKAADSMSDVELIRSLRAVPTVYLESVVDSRELPEEEFNLVKHYLDPVTGMYMTNPVKLHEGIYDLETVLATVQDGKGKNPVTGASFTLADIQPADDVRKDMRELGEYFKEKFPEKKKTSILTSHSQQVARPTLLMRMHSLFGGSIDIVGDSIGKAALESVAKHPKR